jgi:integrase/recombinase XerD
MDNLEIYANKHFEYLEIKNYSPETIRRRRESLKWFVQWCTDRDIQSPQDVTRHLVERYQRHLYRHRKKDGNPLSFKTQQQRLLAIKSFFKFLAQKHYIEYNPAGEIELPKQEKRLPRNIFTQEEVETIINQPDTRMPQGIRDRAILETLYSTGIRRMEIVNLKLYDLNQINGTLMIRLGKGKKDRVVPIGDRALLWVNKYIDYARLNLVNEPDEGYIFVKDDGQPFNNEAMGKLTKKYIKAAGVIKGGSCHLFRHTMATLMLENGADIRYIQQMLGHESLEMTKIYTQVSIKKLKEIHSATHPAKMERTRNIEDGRV